MPYWEVGVHSITLGSYMSDIPLRDTLSNAIGYWERGRLVYNAVLLLIVVFYFFSGWPASKTSLTLDLSLTVFLLAVLANVAYCAAYVVDVFAQLSSLRGMWLRFRWVLFLVGLAFAAVITRFFSLGFFHAAT
jgi:hypothetical protein